MNPPLAAASLVIYHWVELGPQIPSRSPGLSPNCVSPAARLFAWNRMKFITGHIIMIKGFESSECRWSLFFSCGSTARIWVLSSSVLRFLDHIQLDTQQNSSGLVIRPLQRPLPSQDNTTYNIGDKHPCSQRDSNPRSQQPSARRAYTVRPPVSADKVNEYNII
jgi:hypothetical protein